jgi:hypothetical protein
MPSTVPGFAAWLRHQYRPGASYATDPIGALAADVGRRSTNLPKPASLATYLRETGGPPATFAAAGLAAVKYAAAVRTWDLEAAVTAEEHQP